MMRKILGGTVTTIVVATAVGLVCWFIFAAATGASLITFRTGSMAPTMPQGAIAVAMPVTASEIEVGDVVTVQRPGESLPVTHRVVEVRGPDQATSGEAIGDDARELVLKGDDNDENDYAPYVVTDAKRVVFSMAHAGTVLAWLKSPIGMGLLILLVGALTTWAFWPARLPDEADDADETGPDAGSDAGSGRPSASDDLECEADEPRAADEPQGVGDLTHELLGTSQ